MIKCDLLVKDGCLLRNSHQLEEHRDLAVKDGIILEVRERLSDRYEAKDVLDGRNKLIMPGLIDSHMHTGQQLLKGQVLDAKPIIWTRIMLPFESTLTAEKMNLSASLAALEMIRSGTVGFVDAGSYHMEAAARVYEESGLRGALSYSTMDEPGLPDSIAMTAEEAVGRTDELYDGFHKKKNLKVYYSLRALNSCSDRLVELAGSRARERHTLLQAHMNEYQGEINGIMAREGILPYEYLEKKGVLGSHFLGAHSLILSEREMELLRERKVRVCHCPFSNCGKAVPDTPKLLEQNIAAGMGTDGAAHGGLSLWNEMKIFRSVMNICRGVPAGNPKIMPAEAILQMVLEGGAAAIDEDGRCGRLEPGYRGDFISILWDQPHLIPTGNKIHTLLECVNSGDVADSVVGGNILMKDRKVLALDEERIMYEARRYMEQGGM